MKRKFCLGIILAFLLAFQLSPLAYANVSDTVGADGGDVSTEQPSDTTGTEDTGTPIVDDTAEEGTTPEVAPGPAEEVTAGALQAPVPMQSPESLVVLDDEVTVTLKIVGLKIEAGFLEEVVWAEDTVLVSQDAPDYFEATEALLQQKCDEGTLGGHGIDSGMLTSITSNDGVTLAQAGSGSKWSYWELWINGVPWDYSSPLLAEEGATVWEWHYNDGAQKAFADKAVDIKITGVEDDNGTNRYFTWLEAKYYDSSVSAFAATCAVLDRYSLSYALAFDDTFIDSITKADGTVTLASDYSGDKMDYWVFYHNNDSQNLGAYATSLQAGDSLEFKYHMTGENAPVEVVVDPDAPRPDYQADNAGFTTDRVVSSPTPTTTATTELAFKTALKDSEDFGTGISDILLVNGNIYIAAGQELIVFNGSTGSELNRTQLVNAIGSTSRLLYTDGLVVVPLDNGQLQAFTADTLTCVWLTDALKGTNDGIHQSSSTLTALYDDNGSSYLYFGTTIADWSKSYAGTLFCISVATGEVVWKAENTSTGYYWAGAVELDSNVFIADDAGNLTSYWYSYGDWPNDSINLGAPVRSSLTTDGTYLYAMDTTGKLHRISLGDWGTFASVDTIQLSVTSSTSSPVISNGKLFVGGGAGVYPSTYGVLSVVDLATFTLEKSITAPASSQSTPLVVTQGANTYAYFTCNTTPGGIYCYRYGDSNATQIYTPLGTDANYCLATIVAASDGMLYYTNDSGQLFALKVGVGPTDSGTDPGEEKPGTVNTGSGAGVVVTSGYVIVTTVDATTNNTTTNEAAETSKEVEDAATPLSGGGSAASNSSASTGSTGSTTVDELTESSSIPLAVPIAGIAVGGVGLAAAGIWYLRSVRAARVSTK